MSRLKIAIAFPMAIAFLAPAPGAGAEYLVPPDNSAATQYTEAVPTAGGPSASDRSGGRGGTSSPGRTLGSENVRRLDAQGAVGREVVEAVAATAPRVPPADPRSTSGEGGVSADRAGRGPGSERPAIGAEDPGGSSRLGSVLGQATGSSASGGLGPLLPLLMLGTAIWAIAFLANRRRRPAA